MARKRVKEGVTGFKSICTCSSLVQFNYALPFPSLHRYLVGRQLMNYDLSPGEKLVVVEDSDPVQESGEQ